MASPQVQVDISTRLLARAVRELVPTLLPCQNPQPAEKDESVGNYVTAMEVTEVVPLRADDKIVRDAAGARADLALITLGSKLNFPTTATRIVVTPPSTQDAILPAVPQTFLLVSCKFQRFSSTQLHAKGRSDFQTSPGTYDFETDLHRSPQDQLGGALLFAVDALNLFSTNDIGLYFRLLGIFNSVLVGSSQFVDLMLQLATQVGDHVVPLQLSGLLQSFGRTSGPANVGLRALAWTGSPSAPQPPSVGLRLGIDLEPSTDTNGWVGFWNGMPGLLDSIMGSSSSDDLQVAVDAVYLKGFMERSVSTQISTQHLPGGVSLGPPTVTVGTTNIELRIPVWLGFLRAGDAVASVTLSVRGATLPGTTFVVSFIDATVCVRFDENLGTEVLLLLLALLTGGLLFAFISPVMVITGALLGAIAELIGTGVASDTATHSAQLELGKAEPGHAISCGDLDQTAGCRTCSMRADQETPFGRLLMTNLSLTSMGVAGAWSLPASGEPALARLSVTTSGWGYPMVACKAVDPDPVKTITIRNEGGLPLKVCSVTQYVTTGASAKVLEFFPTARTGSAPLGIVQPGSGLAVSVKAHVDDPSYNQASPPPLLVRLFSSAGYWELDLNEADPAQRQSEAANASASAQSAILCDALTSATRQLTWHQLTFTDPIPFTTADIVHERVDIRVLASSDGALEGRDFADRLLTRGFSSGSIVQLSVADSRAPANEHEHPQVAVIASSLGRVGTATMAAAEGTNLISRSLYRESQITRLNSTIVGAARLDDRLVVLTDLDLRVAQVMAGGLERWKTVPIREGTAVACLNEVIAVGTRNELVLLSADLELLSARASGCQALASAGEVLWSADAEGVRMLVVANGELAEQSLTRLPGVVDLAADGEAVLALSDGHLWHLMENDAKSLGLTAERLTTLAGRAAAIHDDGVTVLDETGRVVAEYFGRPWLAGLVEYERTAIEVKGQGGILLLHDRYETELDPERL